MTRDEIFIAIKDAIQHEYYGFSDFRITEKTNFTDDLGMDSLDQIEMIMYMEEITDTEIDDHIAETFKTVEDIIDYCIKNNIEV